MNNMNAFERIIDALQKQGLNSDEILEELKVLFRHLNEKNEVSAAVTSQEDEGLEKRIKKLLFDIGIPSYLNGYDYIIKAVMMYMENPNRKLTQELYPAIANECGTTEDSVKFGMAYAIKFGWEHCDFEVLYSMFGEAVNSKNKIPTRVKFLAMCANYLNP